MSIPSNADLQEAVSSIDDLSRYGLSRISSIARLAITAMESPNSGVRTPDDIKHALSAIWGLADDIENCIINEATRVGFGPKDEGSQVYWKPVSVCRANP